MSPYTTPSARSVSAAVDDLEGAVMRRLNPRAQGMKTLLPECSKIKSTTHAKAMVRVDLPNKQALAIGPLCEAVAAQQQNCRSNSSALHTGYIASMPPHYPFRIYFWLIRDPI